MTDKTRNYSEIILKCYTLIVVGFLLLSIISFALDPFGCLLLRYANYSISSVTILTFSVSILILLSIFKYVPPLPRILCSLSLPIFGMVFNETIWHLGYRIIWASVTPENTGYIEFWTLYSIAIGAGTYILHTKWNILNLKTHILALVGCLALLTTLDWLRITNSGFYQALLLYDQDLGPNPHTPLLWASVSLSRMLWLFLVKGDVDNSIEMYKTSMKYRTKH